MKKLLFSLSAALFLLSACQKENSLEAPDNSPGGGGNTSQGLLRRVVLVAGADSTAADFTYDGSKRLETFTSTSTGGGNTFKRIVRNAAGVMVQFVTKSDDWQTAGVDSVVSNVAVDAQNRYKNSTFSLTLGNVTYNDSTVYNYDGNGNLAEKVSFAQVLPAPFTTYQRVEYTYGSGNVLSEKYYEMGTTGGWKLLATYGYAYDAKTNPVKLGLEAMIALDDGTYFSNNNVINLTIADPADPSNNVSIATTYTYNSANKPSGGTATESSSSGTYTLRYYYYN
ncbi:MAG: hypothetical protein M3Q06_10340 [Bacteroidota bacterium]|nr:hypothetical protein [Bacteroidota bacterium]